jgi:Ca2+/Na+ antiporter
LVFLFAYLGRQPRINRIEGGLLVGAYIAYLVYLLA